MIELTNVTKKYGRKIVLDDVTVSFKKGRISCLLGINGVGKSTTMKAIMKLIPLSGGTISVDGEEISQKNIDKLAYIADIATHDIGCTIKENLAIALVLYPNFDMDKAYKMITFFKMEENKKLKDLSKGNLAKFNILIGLCQNAPYILMDEPFSGIDVFTREEFIATFKSDFISPDQTVILTTHEIDEIECIADDVVLLEDGKVLKCFSKEEVTNEGLTIVEAMRKIYRGV